MKTKKEQSSQFQDLFYNHCNKGSVVLAENRHTDQGNRTENSEIENKTKQNRNTKNSTQLLLLYLRKNELKVVHVKKINK